MSPLSENRNERTLVIVGNGMAAARLCEEFAQRALGRYAVAVVGNSRGLLIIACCCGRCWPARLRRTTFRSSQRPGGAIAASPWVQWHRLETPSV